MKSYAIYLTSDAYKFYSPPLFQRSPYPPQVEVIKDYPDSKDESPSANLLRTKFQKQFNDLLNAYIDWGVSYRLDEMDNINTIRACIFNPDYSGNQGHLYFESIKQNLEQILLVLKDEQIPLEKRQVSYTALCQELIHCPKGIHGHIEAAANELSSDESPVKWIAELRTEITKAYAAIHASLFHIGTGDRIHVFHGFATAARNKLQLLGTQIIDTHPAAHIEDLSDFYKYFENEFNPNAVRRCIHDSMFTKLFTECDLSPNTEGWVSSEKNYNLFIEKLEKKLEKFGFDSSAVFSNYLEFNEDQTQYRIKISKANDVLDNFCEGLLTPAIYFDAESKTYCDLIPLHWLDRQQPEEKFDFAVWNLIPDEKFSHILFRLLESLPEMHINSLLNNIPKGKLIKLLGSESYALGLNIITDDHKREEISETISKTTSGIREPVFNAAEESEEYKDVSVEQSRESSKEWQLFNDLCGPLLSRPETDNEATEFINKMNNLMRQFKPTTEDYYNLFKAYTYQLSKHSTPHKTITPQAQTLVRKHLQNLPLEKAVGLFENIVAAYTSIWSKSYVQEYAQECIGEWFEMAIELFKRHSIKGVYNLLEKRTYYDLSVIFIKALSIMGRPNVDIEAEIQQLCNKAEGRKNVYSKNVYRDAIEWKQALINIEENEKDLTLAIFLARLDNLRSSSSRIVDDVCKRLSKACFLHQPHYIRLINLSNGLHHNLTSADSTVTVPMSDVETKQVPKLEETTNPTNPNPVGFFANPNPDIVQIVQAPVSLVPGVRVRTPTNFILYQHNPTEAEAKNTYPLIKGKKVFVAEDDIIAMRNIFQEAQKPWANKITGLYILSEESNPAFFGAVKEEIKYSKALKNEMRKFKNRCVFIEQYDPKEPYSRNMFVGPFFIDNECKEANLFLNDSYDSKVLMHIALELANNLIIKRCAIDIARPCPSIFSAIVSVQGWLNRNQTFRTPEIKKDEKDKKPKPGT